MYVCMASEAAIRSVVVVAVKPICRYRRQVVGANCCAGCTMST